VEELRRTAVYLPVNASCPTLLSVKLVDSCVVGALTRTHTYCRVFELEPGAISLGQVERQP